MKNRVSLSCSEKQDLERDPVGWHTQFAGRSRTEKGPYPMGYDLGRMSRSCSMVHDVLASICGDITTEVGQADRNECGESRGRPSAG
jgi:hypothetical protein